MICPKCGNEIAEGHLYCEVCGEEIQIVPDFDLQVEESIHVTLSSVAGDVKTAPIVDAKGITKEIPTDVVKREIKQDDIRKEETERKDKKQQTRRPARRIKQGQKTKKYPYMPYVFAGIALVVIAAVALLLLLNRKPKPEEWYPKALTQYRQGEYDLAIESLFELQKVAPLDRESSLLLSDCYFAKNQPDEAIGVLKSAFAGNENDPEYLKRLLDTYIASDDKNAIAELLEETDNEEIRTAYADYIADPPLFSLESGTYTDDEQLSIISEEEGTIRYTLDGSEPDEESAVYSSPFIFDVGEHTVTAVFVNEKGMMSDPVQKTYVIEKKMLDDPVLLTEGGTYSDPKLIALEKPEGAVIYYTDDGSEPTAESNVYNQPIPMPIREKTFRFIVINAEGLTSEVVEATYTLQMVTLVDVTMAENAVQLCLKLGGKSVKQSEYKCSSAYRENEKNYYLVEEYSLQTAEKVKTGRVYAVDVLTGELYKVDMNSAEGDYKLTAF